MENNQRLIHLAHSPDPDDAFMFWALAKNKFDTSPYRFAHILSDIQTLNERAMEGQYEVTAISFYAFPYVSDKYALLSSGCSMGDNYGPMLICPQKNLSKKLSEMKIAIPGKKTSAYLALQLYWGGTGGILDVSVEAFDEIPRLVAEGRYDAGLIIHEGQLTYQKEGLSLYVDVGKWWFEKHQLPLPLGANVVRRDLGEAAMKDLSRLLKKSIQLSLEHRQEAVEYALQFGRGLDLNLADRFIGMYVNELTVDYGERGRKALEVFFAEAHQAGLIPKVKLEFVD
ncbi:MAG: ABC transporter substrate-binding protein [Deltaproteobacteria bacterium]|nr:ABC transporter substrate-binding protein [Deltaproteobacteria bacterium]